MRKFKNLVNSLNEELSQLKLLHLKLAEMNNNDLIDMQEFIHLYFCNNKISIRRFVQSLSAMMYARPMKISLYCSLLKTFSPKIKMYMKPYEAVSLFENKSALLTLLENDVITKDLIVKKYIDRPSEINFFYPEIQNAKKLVNVKLMENDEFRAQGQNIDHIATIIRADDLNAFQSSFPSNAKASSFNVLIKPSRYETFDFVRSFSKKPVLIEYAAFFGAIKIFKFLLQKKVEISETLIDFAVAGGNLDIIRLLENNYCIFDSECVAIAVEFHRPDLIDYFVNSKNITPTIFCLFESINLYNIRYFLQNVYEYIKDSPIEICEQCLLFAINSQNVDVLNLIINIDGIDLNITDEYGVLFLILSTSNCYSC